MNAYHPKRLALKLAVVTSALAIGAPLLGQEVQKVTPCQLANAPKSFDHRIIEVVGFISHGFEDFALFDPGCDARLQVWLEYGGSVSSGTMYCCGVSANRSRQDPLVIEGVPVSLIEDGRYRQFDRLVQRLPDSIVHATLRGRFFAGGPDPANRGFGHMGCCSLLAIEQVISVDPQEDPHLDYRAYPDQPDARCNYQMLNPFGSDRKFIAAQQVAELSGSDWAFDDPQRVASEGLARLLSADAAVIRNLKQKSRTRGRIVYDWQRSGKGPKYMLVVSKPYWLTFYSRDAKRVAWILIEVYELQCD